MPVNENRRLSPSEIISDRNAVSALNDLADYTSVNPNYSAEALATMEEELVASQQKERRAQTALDNARDEVTAKAWALRKAVQGAKAQVIAQYGPDSNAVAALGLKKKSEYRRPARRSTDA